MFLTGPRRRVAHVDRKRDSDRATTTAVCQHHLTRAIGAAIAPNVLPLLHLSKPARIKGWPLRRGRRFCQICHKYRGGAEKFQFDVELLCQKPKGGGLDR